MTSTWVIVLCATALGGPSPLGEVGFLDLTTAERPDEDLPFLFTLSGVPGLKPIPAFRLTLDLPAGRSARPGDTIEVVFRLENITQETLAIPWAVNWKRVLGEVPPDTVEEFPEGYIWAILEVGAEFGAEPEKRQQLIVIKLYGCLSKPETIRPLSPREYVRIRALARIPVHVEQGTWTLISELALPSGFDTTRFQQATSSEPISLEVLAASLEADTP